MATQTLKQTLINLMAPGIAALRKALQQPHGLALLGPGAIKAERNTIEIELKMIGGIVHAPV